MPFLLPPAAASPPCREGLHQSVWEAADWPPALPSVLRHQARAEALHRVHGRRGKTPTAPRPSTGLRPPLTHPLPLVISVSEPHRKLALGPLPALGGSSGGSVGWGDVMWGGVGAISHLDKLSGETPPLPLSSPPWDQAHVRGRSPGRAGRHRPELVSWTLEVCVKKKKKT